MRPDSTQIIVLINETPESIEISKEEYEMIMEKRARQRHKERNAELADELNSLLQKIRSEGFTIGSSNCNTYSKAIPWNDAANNWIKIL